jgi:hypothetical protein
MFQYFTNWFSNFFTDYFPGANGEDGNFYYTQDVGYRIGGASTYSGPVMHRGGGGFFAWFFRKPTRSYRTRVRIGYALKMASRVALRKTFRAVQSVKLSFSHFIESVVQYHYRAKSRTGYRITGQSRYSMTCNPIPEAKQPITIQSDAPRRPRPTIQKSKNPTIQQSRRSRPLRPLAKSIAKMVAQPQASIQSSSHPTIQTFAAPRAVSLHVAPLVAPGSESRFDDDNDLLALLVAADEL